MKKGNVIDLITYRNSTKNTNAVSENIISKELERAIKLLIYRLRELGPLSHSEG